MNTEELDKVKDYIQKNGLDKKNRKRELVDKRAYLYKYLTLNTGFSLTSIGEMFNKNHATVIHGLKNFELMKGTKGYMANVFMMVKDFPIVSEMENLTGVNSVNRMVLAQLNEKEYLKLSRFRLDSGLDTNEQAIKLLINNILH